MTASCRRSSASERRPPGRATTARRARALLLALALLAPRALPAAPATPAPGPAALAAICDQVAAEAAAETGVPLEILRAITRTETGRKLEGALRPWPWTINMEGKGLWFDSREAALAYAEERMAAGARSFDLGCFQVNYRWHGEHFASLAEMIDPRANARYAARYLSQLRAELGDWTKAVGRYHSATAEYAERYKARYERILAALPPMPETTELAALTPPRPASPAPARLAALLVTLPQTPGAVAITLRASQGSLLAPARPLLLQPAPLVPPA